MMHIVIHFCNLFYGLNNKSCRSCYINIGLYIYIYIHTHTNIGSSAVVYSILCIYYPLYGPSPIDGCSYCPVCKDSSPLPYPVNAPDPSKRHSKGVSTLLKGQ